MKNSIYTAIKILACIAIAGGFLYSYISKQNEQTVLRLAIPAEIKELNKIKEENARLSFEIDSFKNPSHLMELAYEPQFAHLKPSIASDVIKLPAPLPLPCDEALQFKLDAKWPE